MQSEVAKLRLGVEAPVAATVTGESGGSSCAGVAAFATEVPEGSPTQAPEDEKARGHRAFRHSESGAGNRIRTGDPQLGNGFHRKSYHVQGCATLCNPYGSDLGRRPAVPRKPAPFRGFCFARATEQEGHGCSRARGLPHRPGGGAAAQGLDGDSLQGLCEGEDAVRAGAERASDTRGRVGRRTLVLPHCGDPAPPPCSAGRLMGRLAWEILCR